MASRHFNPPRHRVPGGLQGLFRLFRYFGVRRISRVRPIIRFAGQRPPGSNRTLIGPYSWFVNRKGIVESLLFSFPTADNTGFQDVFPSQKQPDAIEASNISGAPSANEGTEYTLNLQSSETRPTPTSWEINWGDGEVEDLDGNPSSATHTYIDGDDVVTITAKTTDDEGVLNANSLTLTVSNVAPSIALSGGSTVSAGLPYTLSFGQVTDPGQDTVIAYNVRWGDGETDSYTTPRQARQPTFTTILGSSR